MRFQNVFFFKKKKLALVLKYLKFGLKYEQQINSIIYFKFSIICFATLVDLWISTNQKADYFCTEYSFSREGSMKG